MLLIYDTVSYFYLDSAPKTLSTLTALELNKT